MLGLIVLLATQHTGAPLFQEIRKITRSVLSSRTSVEQILRLPLVPDPAASNEFVDFYRASQKNALVENVDLRISKTGKGRFLVLDIAAKLRIPTKDLRQAFGVPAETRPDVVTIHHVDGRIELERYVLLIYRINGIKTTFRYPAESDRLMSITFDTFEK